MTTVYLALGSNIGDSPANLRKAFELLQAFLSDINQAPVYKSRAVGYTDQPDFLNTAINGQTDLEPLELLSAIKTIEQQIGRTQTFRWGPREIDIDIIFYGDRLMRTDELTLPHPAFRERDFVLQPLVDLNPELTDPLSGKRVQELLNLLEPKERSFKKVLP
jgi:2-amino-4-hydroxy-6-hydroxymethyldihydropteridine diphosphokinase